MKDTWKLACRGRGGCIKFAYVKKRSSDSKEHNTPVALAVSKALKTNRRSKSKAMDDSDPKYELENFNFKKPEIGVEYES